MTFWEEFIKLTHGLILEVEKYVHKFDANGDEFVLRYYHLTLKFDFFLFKFLTSKITKQISIECCKQQKYMYNSILSSLSSSSTYFIVDI